MTLVGLPPALATMIESPETETTTVESIILISPMQPLQRERKLFPEIEGKMNVWLRKGNNFWFEFSGVEFLKIEASRQTRTQLLLIVRS